MLHCLTSFLKFMCTSPISILNRSHFFDKNTSPLRRLVPCGNCACCKSVKVNEWFVRSYYHWQHYQDIGGSTMFITLTYNDENLPCYNGVPCFSKTHIQTFLHKLRTYLKRAHIPSNFTYFVVSEYGTEYERPHYHMLLFLPFKVNNTFDWHNFTNDGFLDRAWIYGFNAFSKKHGAIVKSAAALKYVMKYLSKMDDIYTHVHRKDLPKVHRSFHLQSKGFGSYMAKFINDNDLVVGKVYLPLTQVHNDSNYYTIPLYIRRRLLYTKVNDCYRLSDKGITLKLLNTDKQIHSVSEMMSSLLDKKLPIHNPDGLAEYLGYLDYNDMLSELLCTDIKKNLFQYSTYYVIGRFRISHNNLLHAATLYKNFHDDLLNQKYVEDFQVTPQFYRRYKHKILTDSPLFPSASLFCHLIDSVNMYIRLYEYDVVQNNITTNEYITTILKNNLPKCLSTHKDLIGVSKKNPKSTSLLM